MNKRQFNLLERAFTAEIDGALSGGTGLLQTKSKLADAMVTDGFLAPATVTLGGRFPVVIEGFRLTHAGRLAYSANCDNPIEDGEEHCSLCRRKL